MRRRYYNTLANRLTTPLALGVLDINNRITQAGLKGGSTGESQFNATLNGIWDNLSRVVFVILGFLAIIMLVNAGMRYIAAGGDPAKVKTARAMITNTVLALLLIMFSYIILRLITQVAGFIGRGIS